jgi:hypothetical protein
MAQSVILTPNEGLLERHNARFLFWSYTTPDGVPTTTAVCVERTGVVGDPPEIGYQVDAFDVIVGDFIDVNTNFVEIVGPDRNLTERANNEGFVPTTRMENIRASTTIGQYNNWRVWNNSGENSITDPNLSAPARASAIAFAFYAMPVQPDLVVPNQVDKYDALTTFLLNYLATHGQGDSLPLAPFIRQFASGLMLTDMATKVSPPLQSAVLDIAAKQVSLAAGLIRGKILAGRKTLQADQISTSTALETIKKEELLVATTTKGNGKQSTNVMKK